MDPNGTRRIPVHVQPVVKDAESGEMSVSLLLRCTVDLGIRHGFFCERRSDAEELSSDETVRT